VNGARRVVWPVDGPDCGRCCHEGAIEPWDRVSAFIVFFFFWLEKASTRYGDVIGADDYNMVRREKKSSQVAGEDGRCGHWTRGGSPEKREREPNRQGEICHADSPRFDMQLTAYRRREGGIPMMCLCLVVVY